MLIDFLEEWDTELRSGDPLSFPGYGDRLDEMDHESVRTGLAGPDGQPFVLVEGDFSVIGGSMGLVHGEKVVRAFTRATERRLPVVVVTRSGGARMQEGMVSLIQMSRTAAAVQRHRGAGLLSVSVHRSPTTGGVFASYGSLTDLRVVEIGATIGFAGPRVVEQTTGESVAGRSHSAETALENGIVDAVVAEDELVPWILGALGIRSTPFNGPASSDAEPTAADDEGSAIEPWAAVQAARDEARLSGFQVAAAMVSSWTELGSGLDPTIRAGLATIGDERVVVVATDRNHGTGQPTPAGFRLAQRAFGLAGRLGVSIVTFVDTPGADPRPEAENDGIAGEIARTFAALLDAPVPTVSLCVGEGGSGGALALAAADRFLIQRTAIFSVIGPEGAAAILERDAGKAPEVAVSLKLTSTDLLDLGIVDAVVPDDVESAVVAVTDALTELRGGSSDARTHRFDRFDQATRHWLVEAD